jgi:hypothetical protein
MVTAEGEVVTANTQQNVDLLAASCGAGGGNFGARPLLLPPPRAAAAAGGAVRALLVRFSGAGSARVLQII